MLWTLQSIDLGSSLSKPMADGSALINFYHHELEEIAAENFLVG